MGNCLTVEDGMVQQRRQEESRFVNESNAELTNALAKVEHLKSQLNQQYEADVIPLRFNLATSREDNRKLNVLLNELREAERLSKANIETLRRQLNNQSPSYEEMCLRTKYQIATNNLQTCREENQRLSDRLEELKQMELKRGSTQNECNMDLTEIAEIINGDMLFGDGLPRNCSGTEEFHAKRNYWFNQSGYNYHRCFQKQKNRILHVTVWYVPLVNGRRNPRDMRPLNEDEILIFKQTDDARKGVKFNFGLDWDRTSNKYELSACCQRPKNRQRSLSRTNVVRQPRINQNTTYQSIYTNSHWA